MVSSAEAIISEISVESVADLAKLIVVNYINFPEWNVMYLKSQIQQI